MEPPPPPPPPAPLPPKSATHPATLSGRRTVPFLLRQPRQTRGFREALEADLALTMLWIPPGRFWMGSPEDEGPRHEVQLQGFFMGQTPITQAQWRAVAMWEEREGERWKRSLPANPSFFQLGDEESGEKKRGVATFSLLNGEATSDQRPVECVSWEDAMEFCQRLSQRTGRAYILPSEAQWEYACRANTTTPFAFGDTLTPELANYRADVSYADGPTEGWRQQTTPVGSFPANAWGLQDMHGNVWEWCLDDWHKNYGEENNTEHEKAPDDGSAWLFNEKNKAIQTKLLRGGSWNDDPGDCRSAVRIHDAPGLVYVTFGIRVVCLPQGRST